MRILLQKHEVVQWNGSSAMASERRSSIIRWRTPFCRDGGDWVTSRELPFRAAYSRQAAVTMWRRRASMLKNGNPTQLLIDQAWIQTLPRSPCSHRLASPSFRANMISGSRSVTTNSSCTYLDRKPIMSSAVGNRRIVINMNKNPKSAKSQKKRKRMDPQQGVSALCIASNSRNMDCFIYIG